MRLTLLLLSPLIFSGCASAMLRGEEGEPVGWLAKLIDTVGLFGEAAIEVGENPTWAGATAAILAIVGGTVAVWKGGKKAATLGKAIKEKIVNKASPPLPPPAEKNEKK